MLCGLFHRKRACGSRPSTSRSTFHVAASTTLIVPGLRTPRSSVWLGTDSNWVSIQTSPTPGTAGSNGGVSSARSHFLAFSASVAATAGSTSRTVVAGSDCAPRWPMNGSCCAVTPGMFPSRVRHADDAGHVRVHLAEKEVHAGHVELGRRDASALGVVLIDDEPRCGRLVHQRRRVPRVRQMTGDEVDPAADRHDAERRATPLAAEPVSGLVGEVHHVAVRLRGRCRAARLRGKAGRVNRRPLSMRRVVTGRLRSARLHLSGLVADTRSRECAIRPRDRKDAHRRGDDGHHQKSLPHVSAPFMSAGCSGRERRELAFPHVPLLHTEPQAKRFPIPYLLTSTSSGPFRARVGPARFLTRLVRRGQLDRAPGTLEASVVFSGCAMQGPTDSPGKDGPGDDRTGADSTGAESTGAESTGAESTGAESTGREHRSREHRRGRPCARAGSRNAGTRSSSLRSNPSDGRACSCSESSSRCSAPSH